MNWRHNNTLLKTAYEILSTDLFTNSLSYSQGAKRKSPAFTRFFAQRRQIFTIRFGPETLAVDNFSCGSSRKTAKKRENQAAGAALAAGAFFLDAAFLRFR